MNEANDSDLSDGDGKEEQEKKTQLSPRVPSGLANAYRSFIKLEEGKYRSHQSEYIEKGLKIQLGLWVVGHSYQLHHVYDVDWIEDPDTFVMIALDAVEEVKEIVDETYPQLAALHDLDEDEVNKQTISTLPGKATADSSVSEDEELEIAIQNGDDLLKQVTEVVEEKLDEKLSDHSDDGTTTHDNQVDDRGKKPPLS